MRITINLATRPFVNQGPAIKRLRIAMGALATIAIVLGLLLHFSHRKAEAALARGLALDSKIARINQERQEYRKLMQQPENAQLIERIVNLNQLFDEKSFSWTLAMEDLERVLPRGVQVSTLEPARGKDGGITLHLRVLGPRDRAVELVSNLERSKHFIFPRINGENSENLGAAGPKLEPISAASSVSFDLLADYNPASSAEPGTDEERSPQPRQEKAAKAAASAPETHAPAPATQLRPQAAQRSGPGASPYASVRLAYAAVAPGPGQVSNPRGKRTSGQRSGGPQ